MAEDDTPGGEKPFEASQKKLQDARKKGNVARSGDLNTMAAYGGLVLAALVWGPELLLALGAVLAGFLNPRLWSATALQEASGAALLSGHFAAAGRALVPLFLTPAMLVLVSIAAQRSLIFYGGNITPKLSRISPLANAKKKYGRRGLFEFFKSFVKLCLYGGALIWFVTSRREEIVQSAMLDSRGVILLLGDLALGFLVVALAIAVGLGLADYLFQQAEHRRTLRMSHKEMMDEVKNFEGDPALKQRRRQRAMDIARNAMLRDVKDADVVIVNPEHYAVALGWSREAGSAPSVLAKGVDEMAATIRRLARDNAVPIYREPPTARALFATVEIGAEIAPEHYRAVAAAIRFAEDLRRKQKGRPYGSG